MWDSSNPLFFCMVSDFCGTKPDLIELDFFLLWSLGGTPVFFIQVFPTNCDWFPKCSLKVSHATRNMDLLQAIKKVS